MTRYTNFSCQEEADAWIDMIFQSSHNGKIDDIPYYIVKRLKSYNPFTQQAEYEYECIVEYQYGSFSNYKSWVAKSLDEAMASIKDEIYAFEALASLDY